MRQKRKNAYINCRNERKEKKEKKKRRERELERKNGGKLQTLVWR